MIFDGGCAEMNRELDAGRATTAAILRSEIAEMGGVLGLFQESPAQFLEHQKQTNLAEASLTPEAIEALITERAAAREREEFSARGRNPHAAFRARHRPQGQSDGDDVDGEIAVSETR